MKFKLFDFSSASATITIIAYSLLLTLFGYVFISSGHKILFGIVFLLLFLSLMFVLWYFVLMCPVLTDQGLRHGAVRIKKKNLSYTIQYDARYKEVGIIFTDRKIRYENLTAKESKKKTIIVQATKRNVSKLSAYFGCEIYIPADIKKRKNR